MKITETIDEYKLKKRETINIMPIGDLHIGSKHSNHDFIKYAIRSLKKRKGDKRIYLMGDLVEVASKKVGDSVFKSKEMNVNEQVETLLKVLKPVKSHIKSIVIGNHEKRVADDYNFNITQFIAEQMNIKLYGFQTIDSFKINNQSFSIHSYHGKGASKYLYTAYSKVIRETYHIDADMFLYGHLHQLGHYQKTVLTPNGPKKKHYVLTGHFLDYDGSYAEAANMEYRPESFMILTINGEMRVDSIFFYSDERSWCNNK